MYKKHVLEKEKNVHVMQDTSEIHEKEVIFDTYSSTFRNFTPKLAVNNNHALD